MRIKAILSSATFRVLVLYSIIVVIALQIGQSTGDWKAATYIVFGAPVAIAFSFIVAVRILQLGGLVLAGLFMIVVWLIAKICRLVLPQRFIDFACNSPAHPIIFVPIGGCMFGILYLIVRDLGILSGTTATVLVIFGLPTYFSYRRDQKQLKEMDQLDAEARLFITGKPR